ncbi:hypothetical protein FGG08_004118 [Glutinoglossum americanum]|uniref:Uncharacterized protein n=1 Tax=Glutinoglossum americanum TaxID=1670608 RepID=A0A9P8I1A9_9PEZI|nr:hypothetical protein FGG08_004118 [Glutinoglossum americanum]
MSAKTPLYGLPRPKSSAKAVSSSNSLTFASELQSLLAADSGKSRTSGGRVRPRSTNNNIFTSHNRNAEKRAAKDLDDGGNGVSGDLRRSDIGGVDDVVLHRSKRRMEEKARLYAAMKRGDYVPPEGKGRGDEKGLVDFDRKWAESEARGECDNYETSSDEDDNASEDLIEFTDEFGRQRTGTKVQAEREALRQKAQESGRSEQFSARPAAPEKLIYGDTIQTSAFNPDESITEQMASLVAKRDRSPTPPEEVHYDAYAEVRTKGVGFYAFSKDAEARKQEMEALKKERDETEKSRVELARRKERRMKEVEERRRRIKEQRGKGQAERFLNDLMGEIGSTRSVGDDQRSEDVKD